MRKILGTIFLFYCCLSVADTRVEFNNENDPIAYFTPMDGRYPSFRDASFVKQINLDVGLYIPVLVYINDPAVNRHNVGKKYATVNGVRVGLRFIDDQLQLDRPIMGLNHTPPGNIPNLVNVVGDPDHFVIRYEGHESVFSWNYTR